MKKHFHRELEQLKEHIIEHAGVVEGRVRQAIEAVTLHDSARAQRVIEADHEIDREEVRLEEECLKILALYQPVAMDLRLLISVLKINNDLERIGDHAVNIAQGAARLCELHDIEAPGEILEMCAKSEWMLRESIATLVSLNLDRARAVLRADREVDMLNRQMHNWTVTTIQQSPGRAESIILVLSVAKHLERIADLASNIAEDVLYTQEGEIVRHAPRV